MSMFSNILSKGAEVITNSAKSLTTSNSNIDMNALVKQVLIKIENKLSKQLGENVSVNMEQINAEIQKQMQLQKNLIDTKQKYHNLVSLSETQNENLKQMMQSFLDFFKNLCKSLKNQDMLIPLKDIEAAFYVCNVQKVDKQLKYFFKLYEAALLDFVKGKLNTKSQQCKDQINVVKNLNKNIESQLVRSRSNCSDLQKRLNEMNVKNQQMNQKLIILEKLGAESAILINSKQKQKALQRQNELIEKIKNLERDKQKLERLNRQKQAQIAKANSAIEVIKNNEDSIIDEMKRQIAKKQSSYQSSISRMCNQKVHLQDKIRVLSSELSLLREKLQQFQQQRQENPKKQSRNAQLKQMAQKIKDLQQQNKNAEKKMQSLVSKDMMKNLFLNYQDQSKEWAVRKDIKNQIHLLLDIKSKKDEDKTQEKKWFGFF